MHTYVPMHPFMNSNMTSEKFLILLNMCVCTCVVRVHTHARTCSQAYTRVGVVLVPNDQGPTENCGL